MTVSVPKGKIRVLLVDDVEIFRAGLQALLAAAGEMTLVGEASNGLEAVRLAQETQADVALVDLKMPGIDGVETTRRLRIAAPECRVVILTTFDDDDLVFGALRAGASGYLLKDSTAEQLLAGIRSAARGEPVIATRVLSKVVAEFVRLPPAELPSAPALTPRELDVLTLLARGAVNKEIAKALALTEGTVKNHLSSLFAKLGVTHRTQAALRGRELGLV
jgi:DNA-binding NarL/FixJ family response regulator